MAFTNAIILRAPRLRTAATYIAAGAAVFTLARRLQAPRLRTATTYIAVNAGVLTLARRLRVPRIRKATQLNVIPAGTGGVFTPMIVLGLGVLSARLTPGAHMTPGARLVFFVRRFPAALRASILPRSTGKISHLRILALQRIEAQARHLFDIMKGQI